MTDTYFYIEVFVSGDRVLKLGPYVSYDEAVCVFVEHLDLIIGFENLKIIKYDATITEYMITNKLELINKKLEEKGRVYEV